MLLSKVTNGFKRNQALKLIFYLFIFIIYLILCKTRWGIFLLLHTNVDFEGKQKEDKLHTSLTHLETESN